MKITKMLLCNYKFEQIQLFLNSVVDGRTEACHSCRRVYQKDSPAEVSYGTSIVCCLRCHVIVELLQRTKGKGTVIAIQQRCESCTLDHADQEGTLFWFCYCCSQFMCHQCQIEKHQHENKKVSSV